MLSATRLLATVALGVVLGVAVAWAACGDGVVDPGETCDHGAANGADGCCSSACTLFDLDQDGLCDARDGCNQYALGSFIKDSRLVVDHLALPADERLRFDGRTTLPTRLPLDPSAGGARLTLFVEPAFGQAEDVVVLDALLPASGWRARSTTRWTYRDHAGSVAGITSADVKLRPSIFATASHVDVVFSVRGRHGTYTVTPGMVTSRVSPAPAGNVLIAQLAFDAPTDAANVQCAAAYYTTTLATTCTFRADGNAVTCAGPPRVGPCHTGDPDDLTICDTLDAARAETAYHAQHGTFLTGPCATLPGFVASPGVTCVAAATDLGFVVTTAHPAMRFTTGCTWDGLPDATTTLTCS